MYANQFVQDTEDTCELSEKSVEFCPLCAYQNDNIIQNIAKVIQSDATIMQKFVKWCKK